MDKRASFTIKDIRVDRVTKIAPLWRKGQLNKISNSLAIPFDILKAFAAHQVSSNDTPMDPSPGSFSNLRGGASNDTGSDHSYIKEPVGIGQTHNGDNNLQLVHLLTTNPAAALPAIFPARGSSQKVFPRRTFQLNRPGRMSNINNSFRGGVNNYGVRESDQIIANSWTANVMSERLPFRRQRSFSELYVSKEEIDKKGCCIDKDGNFDFDSLLPVVYWRPELDNDFPLWDDS